MNDGADVRPRQAPRAVHTDQRQSLCWRPARPCWSADAAFFLLQFRTRPDPDKHSCSLPLSHDIWTPRPYA
jgi:hypothetical protein